MVSMSYVRKSWLGVSYLDSVEVPICQIFGLKSVTGYLDGLLSNNSCLSL